MAFFNNNAAYDSYLRRKRSSSTTRERPPRSSISTSSDGHTRKHSPSTSVSIPSTESAESIPPLPSGILPHSTSVTVPAASTTSDPFSTTLHPARNYKRESPPPFSNLMVNPRRNDSPMDQSHSPSPVNSSSPIVPSNELPTRSSSLRRGAQQENKPPRLQIPPPEIEQCPIPISSSSGKFVSPAAKTSSRKSHSHTGSLNNSSSSSSPVTPMLFAPSHPSSPGHSPTSHSFSSGPNSSRSSLKRALLSAYNSLEHLALPGLPSPVSPHLTGKPTPTSETASPIQAGQSGQKRHRNVLRKPSVREPLSKETNKVGMSTKHQDRDHRPRARSITISPTRSGATFDVSQPMPTKALTLTPAGEVQAAYQESQRRVKDIDSNSGKLVAVGVPDCGDILRKKSPSSIRATDEFILDSPSSNKGITGVKNGLTRKLSTKWSKTTDKREDKERFHASSASVTGLPGDLAHGSYSEGRSRGRTSKPIDALISPRQRELKLPAEPGKSREEGRVWEDTVDDWVINQQHNLPPKKDQDVEKAKPSVDVEASNPRRLWKLVKRLSSGNLRGERKVSPEEPPPVPPLPKDLVARSPDHLEDVDMLMSQSPILETPKGIMRYISNIPSLTIPPTHNVSPVPKFSSPQEVAPVSSSPRSPTGAGPSRRLRSETTRSSSPSSGTTGFFSRSRSSSTSSYGETLPPMPDMPLTQTILKHGFHGVVSSPAPAPAPVPDAPERNERRNVRSHSKSPPPPPTQFSPSQFSLPPRRKSHDTSPAGSASIPWFDVQNPINKFLISKSKRTQYSPLVAFQSAAKADDQAQQAAIARRPSTANASSTPPPIPSRSPKRPATSTSSSSMSGTAHSKKFSIPGAAQSQTVVSSFTNDQNPISKPRPRSVSDGVVDSSASMTFREMTSVKRSLTEEEKKAKWEDLLNRSAKAGGTLHVVSRTDNSNLWSENPTAN